MTASGCRIETASAICSRGRLRWWCFTVAYASQRPRSILRRTPCADIKKQRQLVHGRRGWA